MNLALRVDNIIVAIIVSIIFLMNISNRIDKRELQNKVFVIIFTLNTFQLIFETLTCIINKQPFSCLIPITTILHVFLFILGPLITYLWYVFSNLWIQKYINYKSQKHILILAPLILNIFLVFLTPFLKLIFYINQFNVYQRGPLFFVPIAIAYFYLLCGLILVYINRKKISKIEFLPLLLFGVFPALGGLIQVTHYGFLLLWSTIAFSLIILYLYLQQEMIHIDYLTGAWTREKFYNYLTNRISQKNSKDFSIAFIDLDDFKKINDTFGHNEGDRALKDLVYIVKNILKNEDFIARYGGDEFILFLNVDNEYEVESIIMRISDAISNYNKHTNVNYELTFSYGYKLYNFDSDMTANEFINHVDKLMYQNKNNKKHKNTIYD